MDPLTQGVIGAASAQSVARPGELRRASVIGFLSGLVADVDVFIRSATDPMLVLEYHRHFTHSLFFIPIGALVAALVLWPLFRRGLSFRRIYLYAIAGYLFSGFIDTCTSYGTYLLWPLTETRYAWHIISIIDPIFTLGLILAVVLAYRFRRTRISRFGFLFASGYLLLGYVQLQRAESIMFELAEQRGHVVERHMVKPTFGNLLLWRTIYLADDRFYVDAVRVAVSPRHYPGEDIERFDSASLPAQVAADTTLYHDIERFHHFSDGFVAYYPGRADILGDVRYALSPLSVTPLWGIEMDFARPEQHIRYEFYRSVNRETRQQFADMLLGRDID